MTIKHIGYDNILFLLTIYFGLTSSYLVDYYDGLHLNEHEYEQHAKEEHYFPSLADIESFNRLDRPNLAELSANHFNSQANGLLGMLIRTSTAASSLSTRPIGFESTILAQTHTADKHFINDITIESSKIFNTTKATTTTTKITLTTLLIQDESNISTKDNSSGIILSIEDLDDNEPSYWPQSTSTETEYEENLNVKPFSNEFTQPINRPDLLVNLATAKNINKSNDDFKARVEDEDESTSKKLTFYYIASALLLFIALVGILLCIWAYKLVKSEKNAYEPIEEDPEAIKIKTNSTEVEKNKETDSNNQKGEQLVNTMKDEQNQLNNSEITAAGADIEINLNEDAADIEADEDSESDSLINKHRRLGQLYIQQSNKKVENASKYINVNKSKR
jgi:hypothetical protein